MIPTIGLEVHMQLRTQSKIFCPCAVEFGSAPNQNVCPVCLGLPGALPVLNREVFRLGLRAALALEGTPSPIVKFDRKNYFYPDLPKGYQISQYDHPLGKGGFIEIEVNGAPKRIRLNRLHLEEDAGKLLHDQLPDSSVVDLNRAGTALAEIVSEADLESPEEAYEYLINLKAILKCTGVSECDMEKGQLRCDANVSVRKNTSDSWGTRVEIKNLNSFKAVKASIQHEIDRQGQALDQGEKILQETRLWDDKRQKTFPMRSKEHAHDYRYFPEPDLLPFFVSREDVEEAKNAIPELPKAKAERFVRAYGLTLYDAKILNLDKDVADFYEECVKAAPSRAKPVANWLTGPVAAYLNAKAVSFVESGLSTKILLEIVESIESGKISLQAAKDKLFPAMIESKQHAMTSDAMIESLGLKQVSDDAMLEAWVLESIQTNPKVVQDFKSGKESAAMFLIGQVMKKSQGKANPGKVKELMTRKLQGG